MQKEILSAYKSSTFPPHLSERLIEEKNEEITELMTQLRNLKSKVREIIEFLAQGESLANVMNMVSTVPYIFIYIAQLSATSHAEGTFYTESTNCNARTHL